MSEKLITFVVPSYNSEAYLNICVDSLIKGGDDVEILIVNDGSTDGTKEIGEDYEKRYPGMIRLLNQENGGHGEGINHGLKEAKGIYFKVVDSDDWVDETALKTIIAALKKWKAQKKLPDMMVANYVYENREKDIQRVIRFGSIFPEGRVVGWNDTSRFHLWQNLTLHSCMFRTSIIRKSGVVLPKHVFYEDNFFVFVPMAYVNRLAYLNVDFYRYLIGRDGQSVANEALKKHCMDQVTISKLVFATWASYSPRIRNKRKKACLYHHLKLMMCLASIFPRLNDDEEHDIAVQKMWRFASRVGMLSALRVRFFSYVFFLNIPGKAGRRISAFIYRLSNIAVPFN